ncbi:hypothetical protein SAMN05443270_1103 [Lacrimispora sphenoides]|uniref:hypothetical protein n=1 Tax=Lacrimispora sphenoides TaxID=29370 RepID=UPI0008BAE4EF|nr:hypothetical protein [Lacrimispora sphenoides]SET71868.1 hypothetical protein SAMN05443270_1103 [Lacrimispora sphenoides]
MSRKHKTLKAGSAIGMNQFDWGNGGKRKRPTGAPTPAGQCNIKINYNPDYTGRIGGLSSE